MQIPPIESFRQADGIAHGPPFSLDLPGRGFTLTIPEGDATFEPHEPSYRMAMDVLDELDELVRKGVEFLEETVVPGKLGAVGEPSLFHVQCDARTGKVTLEMSWETNVYAGWSVTYSWPEGRTRWPWPVEMGLRPR